MLSWRTVPRKRVLPRAWADRQRGPGEPHGNQAVEASSRQQRSWLVTCAPAAGWAQPAGPCQRSRRRTSCSPQRRRCRGQSCCAVRGACAGARVCERAGRVGPRAGRAALRSANGRQSSLGANMREAPRHNVQAVWSALTRDSSGQLWHSFSAALLHVSPSHGLHCGACMARRSIRRWDGARRPLAEGL